MSYMCNNCKYTISNLSKYNLHQRLHRNERGVRFVCKNDECGQEFTKYTNFSMHVFRNHSNNDVINKGKEELFICNVQGCSFKCHMSRDLLSHTLKNHLLLDSVVNCPHPACKTSNKKFTNTSQFKSHFYRKHSLSTMNVDVNKQDCDGISNQNVELENIATSSDAIVNSISLNNNEDQDENNTTETIYLNMLATMYMTLQTKHFVTDAALQTLIESMQDLNEISNRSVQKTMNELGIDVPAGNVTANNYFYLFHNNQNGLLRTAFARKQYFKKTFNYVDPMCLNYETTSNAKFFYVPILQTLTALMKNSNVYSFLRKDTGSNKFTGNLFTDVTDGQVFRENTFFQSNPNAFRIILYQDAFEICNPLGSSRKIYKLLAVYMVLGNIPVYSRSKVDNIHLVALAFENDVKKYGFGVFLNSLVNDIQVLETEGIAVNGSADKIKGSVVFVAGDNLGSHQIGGYVENFSTNQYFCRYCYVTKAKFNAGKFWGYKRRTKETYECDLDICDITGESFQGLKLNSVLNKLSHYHVANPGLPPCVAHDLYEGVVQYDLQLAINYFVNKKNFTYAELNNRLQSVVFSGEINREKIPYVKKSDKLPGNASENSRLLLIFPLAVHDLIHHSDQVWKSILLLREICSLVMAFKISVGQVAHLGTLLREYVSLRSKLFPNEKLRPKHHFILHYHDLILKFGPLRNVWTLRFESKHKYFKNIIRHSPNFKNVLFSFTEKHQLLQALLISRNDFFNNKVCAEHILTFESLPTNLLSFIQEKCQFKKYFVTEKVVFRSLEYKRDMFICYNQNEDGYYELCQVMNVLIHSSYDKIAFAGKKYISTETDFGVLEIFPSTTDEVLIYVDYNSLIIHEQLLKYISPTGKIFLCYKSAPLTFL